MYLEPADFFFLFKIILFFRDVQSGKAETEGWGSSNYVVSKVGISAFTNIQQRIFDEETPSRGISINSVHPGWVRTDMTGNKGHKSSEQGAAAPLWLALEANLKGKYVWDDCSVVDWCAKSTPPIPPL